MSKATISLTTYDNERVIFVWKNIAAVRRMANQTVIFAVSIKPISVKETIAEVEQAIEQAFAEDRPPYLPLPFSTLGGV